MRGLLGGGVEMRGLLGGGGGVVHIHRHNTRNTGTSSFLRRCTFKPSESAN
jgi:hypothetical protein